MKDIQPAFPSPRTEFELIMMVFNAIISAPEFEDSPEARKACSELVLTQYRQGAGTYNTLLDACRPRQASTTTTLSF